MSANRLYWFVGICLILPLGTVSAQETVLRRATLIVHDIDRSIEFYSQILDFEVWLDLPGTVTERSLPSSAKLGDPSRFVIMKGKHPWIGMIGLLQYGPSQPVPAPPAKLTPSDVVLMLETENLTTIYQRMKAAGTPMLRELESSTVTGADGHSWEASFVFAYDPDGHLLELNQRSTAAAETASTGSGVPEIRRRYVDYRYGQLHLREVIPAKRIISQPPLLLFHQTPLSSRMFEAILPELAKDRIVYALDTPGYGESSAPPEPLTIEQYAAAVTDFVTTIPTQVDVMGYHTGVLLAMELANTLPDKVRKAVLVAVPLFSEARRQSYTANKDVISEDGSHLQSMWDSSMQARPPGQSLERAAQMVAEKQRAGRRSWWAGPAIFGYDTAASLQRLQQPLLVIRPKDGLWDNTGRALDLVEGEQVIAYPDLAYGFSTRTPSV